MVLGHVGRDYYQKKCRNFWSKLFGSFDPAPLITGENKSVKNIKIKNIKILLLAVDIE